MDFTQFPLDERLRRAVEAAGYQTPTPIQEAALPTVLDGHDLIATAQTGTGKTAVFVLPILQKLLTSPHRHVSRALILAPTRELVEQIHAAIQVLGRGTPIRSAPVYGGVGMAAQEQALRKGIDIIVACPGRLIDHITRGYVDLRQIDTLVLDEADRMLDMGFLPPITRIVGLLPVDRQTLLFSATFPKEIDAFAARIQRTPQRIDVGISAPAETVNHALYPVPKHLKTALLIELLRKTDTDSVLVFTRTKHRANRITEQLNAAGFSAGVLHANKSQNHRTATMEAFRAGKIQLLIATDIVARGIDVTSISHVINYDIPDCADAYIHRIGRTGRMERTGDAVTFVTPDDAGTVREIEQALKSRIERMTVEAFDYTKPAPRADEFARAPRPPRQASTRETRPREYGGRASADAAPARERRPRDRQADGAGQTAPGNAARPHDRGGRTSADAAPRRESRPRNPGGNHAAPSRESRPQRQDERLRADAAPGRDARPARSRSAAPSTPPAGGKKVPYFIRKRSGQ